ncbi:uncharacterized protein SRS1_11467 [Sporisorium reilianum f. sp. reilianum]|uniref:Uncharacterized protein n=1 Tax=Sporisorium reilianum f. sp. reilianum TaxID=72559 RepID=A0A2N8U570_9BASI|nr:uncharacterized protein SRS1_11467 [Sporisorium reilianum f. sp. reilianum]
MPLRKRIDAPILVLSTFYSNKRQRLSVVAQSDQTNRSQNRSRCDEEHPSDGLQHEAHDALAEADRSSPVNDQSGPEQAEREVSPFLQSWDTQGAVEVGAAVKPLPSADARDVDPLEAGPCLERSPVDLQLERSVTLPSELHRLKAVQSETTRIDVEDEQCVPVSDALSSPPAQIYSPSRRASSPPSSPPLNGTTLVSRFDSAPEPVPSTLDQPGNASPSVLDRRKQRQRSASSGTSSAWSTTAQHPLATTTTISAAIQADRSSSVPALQSSPPQCNSQPPALASTSTSSLGGSAPTGPITSHSVRPPAAGSPSQPASQSARDASARLERLTPGPGPLEPPPRARRAPTPTDIIEWAERLSAPVLYIRVAGRIYPDDWIVIEDGAADKRLRALALRRVTEACAPWPVWTCQRCEQLDVPCFTSMFRDPLSPKPRLSSACCHCYAGGRAKCLRTIPRDPAHVYTGDLPSWRRTTGNHEVERAHMVSKDGLGMGEIRRQDRVHQPEQHPRWKAAMDEFWHLPRECAKGVHLGLRQFYVRRQSIVSQRSPLEARAEAGSSSDASATSTPVRREEQR